MRDFWFRRLWRKNDDEGMAMAMVVGIGAVLILLVTSVTSVAISGITKATSEQDWAGAISAAYAGISDYQSRLANDYSYVQYGNPDALFAKGVPGNVVALPPTSAPNPAFGIGPTGTWATVAGSNDVVGGTPRASYRYEVDNSKYSSTGILRLRSTGKVGNVTRTIVADLKQQGFIDFLYFTDYEMLDPDINSTSCTVAHAWELSTARSSSCVIQFVKADEIKGPLHSNDTLDICGGKFDQTVTSSNSTLKNGVRYTTIGCSPTYTPTDGTGAALNVGFAKPISMPATNSKMIQETRNDLPQTVQRPGCLYTGPTTIKFNADGTMTVRSPWTKKTQIAGDPPTVAGSTAPADCGTPGDPTKSEAQNVNTLSGANGQTITITNHILDHNLVYVQGVKTTATDPNYWASNKTPNNSSFKCVGQTTTDVGNGLGYPKTNEKVPDDTAMGKSYDCQAGDVFVQGTVNAAMTVAASHYVYVVGDIVREDAQNDILGLVGTGAVWVWNPVNSSGTSLLGNTNRKIEAAILSVAHSFQVQNYTTGGYRGQLQVTGAIAQKFRGTVGTGNGTTGYTKQYVYDPRLRNIAPPKFLSPVSTTYGVNVLVEVKAAYSADGTAIP